MHWRMVLPRCVRNEWQLIASLPTKSYRDVVSRELATISFVVSIRLLRASSGDSVFNRSGEKKRVFGERITGDHNNRRF